MQEQILDLLIEKEDVTWRTILFDLVKTEQMDPWDVNLSLLTKRYIDLIKEMQEHDLKISGKVLLAAAFLLKIKSAHFLDHDITNLDKLMQQTENQWEDDLLDFSELGYVSDKKKREKHQFTLIPRQPQPRDRKVSIHDLVNALQNAMQSRKRILAKQKPVKYNLPKRTMDIMEVIRDLYHKIAYYTHKKERKNITFSQLLPPEAKKRDKVYTFIPLLHLENQQKISTKQTDPFKEINVKLMNKKSKAKVN